MTSSTQLLAATAACILTVSACASSGGDTNDAGPDVTLGTVPASADTTPSDSAPSDTDPSDTDPSDTGALDTVVPDETVASTTTLVPSPGADLPTEPPQTVGELEPVTTVAGPLPIPTVQLVSEGTYSSPVEGTTRAVDQRLFLVEQGGTVVAADDESVDTVFDIGTVDATTFSGANGEQGLLGIAFHPSDDFVYINFTNGDGNTVIAELSIDPVTAAFDTESYREVLTVEQPFANHNGGEIAFGPDEMLYIGLGDGGAADDPNRDALDLTSRLGKMLRIDPRSTDDAPFTVPTDNPFVDAEGVDPTIWSIGLRNPWKFSFDALTGDLWIADVGQNELEEINLAPAVAQRDAGRGLSFGWSAFEAAEPFNDDQPSDGHTLPVASYSHDGGNCSISGGVVARSSSYADLNGWYVYGDFCSGTVWALDTTSVASTPDGPVGDPVIVELTNVPALVAVIEGPFGDIYTLSGSGEVSRLAPA